MLKSILILFAYIIGAVALAFLLKVTVKVPRELMRKILHLIIAAIVFIYVYAFSEWYVAALTAAVFAGVAYPIIMLFERSPKMMEIFNERTRGEVRTSLLIVHAMFIMLICIFWGWLGEEWKYIIIAAVMAWGLGDASAALIGKKFGRHKVMRPLGDGKKTSEGSFAMGVVSGVALLVTFLLCSGKPWYASLIVALIVAPICTIVELASRRGIDTITVPLAVAAVSSLLMYVLTVLGI